MIFEDLNIIGWERIEPTILAAIISNSSILFVGEHGTNKTNGFKRIARSLLGSDIECRRYNTPSLQVDDFMGYINPASLSKERIEWVSTGLSIWDADAALFDEISRANPGTTNKLLEAVWEGTVHGTATNLQFTAATMNPPGKYNSMYLGPALAARFVCVKVPGSKELDKNELARIINMRLEQVRGKVEVPDHIKRVVEAARKVTFSDTDRKVVTQTAIKILKSVNGAGVYYSPRQAQMCAAMIEAYEAAKIGVEHVRGEAPDWDDADAATVVLSTIPECFEIVKGSTEEVRSAIEGKVRTILASFNLKDPLALAEGVIDLIGVDYPDSSTQVAEIIKALTFVKDKNKLLEANTALKTKVESFSKEEITIIAMHIMGAYHRLDIDSNPDTLFKPGEIFNKLVAKRRGFSQKRSG